MIGLVSTPAPASSSRTTGSQTLARGLLALQAVAAARDGLTIHDVADGLGVHRTIAYRILNTLADAHLVQKSSDGYYRGASGLLALASAAHGALRAAALPVMTDVANRVNSTVSLLVRDGSDAVALAVVRPTGLGYHVSFAEGSRHSLERGAAGHAILACDPASERDSAAVLLTRSRGYAETFGEVEPGMFGLAAPIPQFAPEAAACLNLITTRRDLTELAAKDICDAAQSIADRLR